MSEEEKYAIEDIKEMIELYEDDCLLTTGEDIEYMKIILNIIEKQQKEIEKLKEAYQILKDDIEGHNVVYVDTPEFEENYISKDKIKEKIEKIKEDEEFYRERDRMYEFDGKINILKELLGE